MSWNYRIVCDTDGSAYGEPNVVYLAEVYYRGDDRLPYIWSKPFAIQHSYTDDKGTAYDTVQQCLNRMKEALDKPILNHPGDFND